MLTIAEFILNLLTGEVWRAWQEHKAREAQNAANDVAAMSDKSVADKLRSWTK